MRAQRAVFLGASVASHCRAQRVIASVASGCSALRGAAEPLSERQRAEVLRAQRAALQEIFWLIETRPSLLRLMDGRDGMDPVRS